MMIVITLIGFVITIISIYLAGYIYKDKPAYTFSFEDSITLCKLPIVSFEHNGKTVNFLIDSGASHCIINSNSISIFNHKLVKTDSHVYGLDGNRFKTNLAFIELTKNGRTFQDTFQVLPVPGLENIKKSFNVEVHGILGNTFLKKYQFLINYKHLIATTNG